METPQYVLKFNEAVLMPGPKSRAIKIFRVAALVVVAIMILYCLVFQENILSELSWSTKALLFCILVCVFTLGNKKVDVPSPIELQFYSNRLVVYWPKRYYSNRITRRETVTMNYTDITQCKYLSKYERVHIYGTGKTVVFKMEPDGYIPTEPTEIRHFDGGMIYFSLLCAPELDIKSEIEAHSPIQVTIET